MAKIIPVPNAIPETKPAKDQSRNRSDRGQRIRDRSIGVVGVDRGSLCVVSPDRQAGDQRSYQERVFPCRACPEGLPHA